MFFFLKIHIRASEVTPSKVGMTKTKNGDKMDPYFNFSNEKNKPGGLGIIRDGNPTQVYNTVYRAYNNF